MPPDSGVRRIFLRRGRTKKRRTQGLAKGGNNRGSGGVADFCDFHIKKNTQFSTLFC